MTDQPADETRHILEPDGLERRLTTDSRKGALPIELSSSGAQEIARRLDPSWMVTTQEEREALARAVAEVARKGRYVGVTQPQRTFMWQQPWPQWQRDEYKVIRPRREMERAEAQVEIRFGIDGERERITRWVRKPGALSRVADPYVLHGGEPVPLEPTEEARKIADLLGVDPAALTGALPPEEQLATTRHTAEEIQATVTAHDPELVELLNTEPDRSGFDAPEAPVSEEQRASIRRGLDQLAAAGYFKPTERRDEAPDPEEGCTLCVSCGERPWGYGYCGEECEECAHENG